MSLDDFLNAQAIDMRALAEEIPSLIRFETEENQKNGYQTIQQIFAKAAQEMKGQSFASQQEKTAYYMEALASCAPLIDKEVFDHYKNLEQQYKDVLHQIAGCLDQFQPDCRKMIQDSIRKACSGRMILAEKYSGLTKEEDK